MLVEPHSPFATKFYHESYLKDLEHYDPNKYVSYAQDGLHAFYRKNMAPDVHIEDDSLNRPLPFDGHEGFAITITGNYDLSKNYVLHIHPRHSVLRNPKLGFVYTDTEEEVRRKDTSYGAAARIAYFGSPDLIFKPGEKTFERIPTIKVKP
uniref:Uncharacterized protein n=1 Tax=Ciona savignyi TaxID=51511 RepID=H2YYK5_CIOSA